MYEFSCWCLLCASERDVEVEIQSLDEAIRENIGQFTLINFTLQGVPSKICYTCFGFLKQYEVLKERYARTEQMFLELLRMKNKTNVSDIREKYNLADDSTSEFDASTGEKQEFLEIEDVVFEDIPIAEVLETKNFEISEAPKLLNPTIRHKIVNKNRIDFLNCDFCSHSTSTKQSMERHMTQLHMDKSAKMFKCSVCPKTFAKKNILKSHEKIHLANRPTFDCQYCGKNLSSQTAVRNHIKWLHNEEREFDCSKCSKKFATKGSLKEHEKSHSEIKSHSCPICKKTYKTASTLSQHLDTHGETEYSCPQCSLRLNSKRTLKYHMLRHSDVIHFTCEVCNAQFKRSKAYKEHIISKHTKIRPYQCDWCQKSFANGANCRKHKKESHPRELAQAERCETKQTIRLPKVEELLLISLESKHSI